MAAGGFGPGASPGVLTRGYPWTGGTFADLTEMKIPSDARLDVFPNAGGGQGIQIYGRTRNGDRFPTSGNITLFPGQPLSFDGRVFSEIRTPTGVTSALLWALVPLDAPPTFGGGFPGSRSPSASKSATFVCQAVTLYDDSGIVYQNYAGSTACPCDGIWHVMVQTTSGDVIMLSDGKNAYIVATGTGEWQLLTIPVVKGTTFVLSSTGGLAYLGAKGWIGPA